MWSSHAGIQSCRVLFNSIKQKGGEKIEEQPESPKRESQVDSEFSLLFDAIERLTGTVSRHEKTISQVLKPEEPEKEGEKVSHTELVPTADKIRNARFRIIGANRALERISNRVEL